MPAASAILWLLEPGKPIWIKVLIVAVLVVAAAAWWTRDYWQDLHTPTETKPEKWRARPPF